MSCNSSPCKQVLTLVEDLYKFQGHEPPCIVLDIGFPDAAPGTVQINVREEGDEGQVLTLIMLCGAMSSGDKLPPQVQEVIKHFAEKPTTRSFDCIKNAYI